MRESIPKVSVIMSVYNGERFLHEAVESILNQPFKNFEFIIINDGSTDGSREIIESYNDDRIVLINQDKTGLTKALNKGISLARGEYVARMDADDVSLPERLEHQVAFLDENPDVGLVGCNIYVIDEKGSIISMVEVPIENEEIKWKLLFRNRFGHSAIMFRKECLSIIGGYNESIIYAQDYDLWLRISQNYNLGNLREFLHKWRLNKSTGISMIKTQEQYKSASLISDKSIQKLLPQEHLDSTLLQEVRDYVNLNIEPSDLRRVESMLFKILGSFWESLPGNQNHLKEKRKIMQSNYYMNFALLYYNKDKQKDFRRCAIRSIITNWSKFRVGIIFLIIKSLLKSLLGIKLLKKIRMMRKEIFKAT